MQTTLVISHIAGTLGKFSVSAPLRAVVLLAVLVTHLAFMVTPLHAWMLTERSHTGVMEMESTVAGDVTGIDQRTGQDEQAGHCIIQWTKAAQGMALASFLAIVPASTVGGLEQYLPQMRLLAQAHGPPHGDRQALLQVFRL